MTAACVQDVPLKVDKPTTDCLTLEVYEATGVGLHKERVEAVLGLLSDSPLIHGERIWRAERFFLLKLRSFLED
ncbi:MAG: hypothetical protein ACREMY_06935, partial [bacterium]